MDIGSRNENQMRWEALTVEKMALESGLEHALNFWLLLWSTVIICASPISFPIRGVFN